MWQPGEIWDNGRQAGWFPSFAPVIFRAMSASRLQELRRPPSGPWVIGHRGASARAPENTLPAFEAAWAAGCAWIEADVQPTSDNVPMMLHDDDLDRTTNGRGPIRHRSAQEIRTLDAGSWFRGDDAGGARTYSAVVPYLTEVLEYLTPARSLLLEIKGAHTREQVRAELAALAASGRDDRVLLESFEVEALRYVHALQPGRPVGLLVHVLHADPVAACAEVGAVAYNPDHRLLRDRPEVVGELHAAGLATVVYTADDPADWAFLTDLGVDGIVTNTPAELVAWQAAR